MKQQYQSKRARRIVNDKRTGTHRDGNPVFMVDPFLYWFCLFVFGVGVICCMGCSRCSREDHIAELVNIQKSVTRDFANEVGKWQTASAGDRFSIGDGLKTEKESKARLRLIPEGQMLVDSNTLIRFQATPPDKPGQRVQIETGSVEIESGKIDLQVHTVVGLSLIEKGSRVRIHSTNKKSRFDVLVGKIKVDNQGNTMSITPGNHLELMVGGVIIEEKEASDEKETAPEDLETLGTGDDTKRDMDTDVNGDTGQPRGEVPQFADLTIGFGESATIHDPRPPTNIRFPFRDCEKESLLEVGKMPSRSYRHLSSRGQQSTIVRLSKGRYLYRIRCLEDGKPVRNSAAKGNLHIIRDAAVRRLPKKKPTIIVEADGRNYTVRYQNHLPKITFRWPDPAKSTSYRVQVTPSEGKTIKKSSSTPEVTFKSGKLGDGVHTFYFSTSDGRKSRKSSLRIIFDNRARTAYLQEPTEGQAIPGQAVRIKGTVLMRSQVSVLGKEVPINPHGKFEYETTAPTDDRAVSIRVKHKTSRIHYYLRHVATE